MFSRMAINITFMIGNGFDRQQGLKTSYKSFYEWNSNKDNHPDYNENNMIYKSIVRDVEKWSDFESALGEFTKNELVKINNKEQFFIDLDEVIDDLINYLQFEELNFVQDETKLKTATTNTLASFYKELAPKERDRIESLLKEYDSSLFNVICFNYTNIVERFVVSGVGSSYNLFEQRYASKILRPLYVHGTHDYHAVIGVDNASQLNEGFFTADDIAELTKFSIIEESRDTRLDDAKRLIENSNIIVIFGMSLGETDASWWRLVGEWLATAEDRYLIIHSFERNYSTRLTRQVKRVRKKVEDRFLNYVEVDEETKNRLREQIFIIVNSQNTFMIEG